MSVELGEGSHIIKRTSDNVEQLKQYVQSFSICVEKIGGREDNERMRSSMVNLIEKSNSLSKAISALMKQLVLLSNSNPQYRVQRERLMDEYMGVLNRLQAAQRKAASKEKAQIKTVTVEDEMLAARQTTGDSVFTEGGVQLQQQHRINLNEIRERKQTLSQLEADISDVNQIFKDLARIVHDQGEMVDSIEANIEHASIHVEQGHVNVQQALYYQTKSRQKKLLLLVFFGALIGIILLFLYLYAR